MPKRQPLYPHVPKSRQTISYPNDEVRFFPDSPETLDQTVQAIGYRDRLSRVFQAAIARAKGTR